MAYMSEEGYNKLLADLNSWNGRTPKIVAAIAKRVTRVTCRKMRNMMQQRSSGLLEMKINKLKQVIADAKIIDIQVEDRQCTDIE